MGGGGGEGAVGWGGAVGVGAGGCGHALNTFSPRKCEPSLGSGEEMRARWVRAVGVVRARGGVGTHWQPLNTL